MRPIRVGSTSCRRASFHASCSVASATCAEKEALRMIFGARSAGTCSDAISAPRNAVFFWRPGRVITPNADWPAKRARVKASRVCPIAVVTPTPVMTASGSAELRMQQLRQLTYVARSERFDTRDLERQRIEHQHHDLRAVDRVGAEIL